MSFCDMISFGSSSAFLYTTRSCQLLPFTEKGHLIRIFSWLRWMAFLIAPNPHRVYSGEQSDTQYKSSLCQSTESKDHEVFRLTVPATVIECHRVIE